MARILKKIQQKTSSVEKPAETRPPGKDYILIFLIMLSIMVIGASWEAFDAVMLSMYILNKSSLRVPDDARHTRQLCHHRHGSSTLPHRCVSTLHRIATQQKNADVVVGVFYLHSVQFTSHRPQPRTAVHEIFQVRSQRIS